MTPKVPLPRRFKLYLDVDHDLVVLANRQKYFITMSFYLWEVESKMSPPALIPTFSKLMSQRHVRSRCGKHRVPPLYTSPPSVDNKYKVEQMHLFASGATELECEVVAV